MMARMAGEVLEKQGDIRTKGLTEVEKEESKRELGMAMRGGQEEIAMATKRMARGRRCVSTEGSMSIARGCRYDANINCNSDIYGYSQIILFSKVV